MAKVAISACLIGSSCRYDGNHNLNEALLSLLKDYEIIPFCPEDACFGTPRETMDLVKIEDEVVAISNETQKNLSDPIELYAHNFFLEHPDIELFIGKDRSPSCGVKSAKVYDEQKRLIDVEGTGLMAKEAIELGIPSWDAEVYEANHTS